MKTQKPSLRSQEDRDKMALDNAKLVSYAINTLRHVPAVRGMDRDDAAQAGWLGLLRACELFDPSMGFRPSTYLTTAIKRAILAEAFRNRKWHDARHHALRDDKFLAPRQTRAGSPGDPESLRKVIEDLPEKYRRMVEDRLAGITFREAAERDGISPEASRQRFQAAVRVLKSSLSGEGA